MKKLVTTTSSLIARLKRVRLLAALGLLITLLLVSAAPATVPGPNGLIAFRANVGNGDQIYTIAPDGSGQMQLTHLDGDALQPHWSPDGRLIVFELDAPDTCANVAYMHTDGSHLVVLPLANGDECEGTPSFSPDGQRIYYEGYNGHRRDTIWSMALDGTHRHPVTPCERRGVTAPEVSPDGTLIAFTCFTDDGQALFVSRIDGSHLRQLTPFSLHVGTKEDWSPDSSHIMFISDSGDTVNTATIRPDGTDLRWVTNYGTDGPKAYGNSYSPDGQWIVLRLEENDLYALYKIHPDGSGLQQITAFSTFRPRGMAWGSAS
jgi:Tol biopolymer transport system component